MYPSNNVSCAECQQVKESDYDINEVHKEVDNFIISTAWEMSKSAFKYAKQRGKIPVGLSGCD